MATRTSPAPAAVPTTSSLYEAVEGLKEMAVAANESLVNGDGDLLQLRDELGDIRDRANTIQDVAIAFISAINEHL